MKYYGKIGFVWTEQTSPGVWEEQTEERYYRGDVVRNTHRWEPGVSINDNLAVNVSLSILADSYAIDNSHRMKYAEYMGTLWKIVSIEPQRPRLLLSIGGEYNGEQT